MAELKTFLFTDVLRSVDLKGEMPGRSDAERDQAFIEQILTPHRERIERELADHGGRVVSTAGDGHFLVFSDTILAARWAVGIQKSHRDQPIETPHGNDVAVRISMHIGIPQIDPRDPNNFVGKPVDYAARLNDYASGGQILVSRSVVAILEDAGMDRVSFHRHGKRELKGIGQVDVYELVYDESGPQKTRQQPRRDPARQWSVLPATMGLTEYHAQGSSSGGALGTSIAPSKLGNYELSDRLGSGGMGDVYKARHVQFNRVRAMKVIKQQFVDSGHRDVVRRFYQEIKAVGALEHPNIVVAIDSSAPTDPVHYLVMEFIDGIGADKLVGRHGPLPVAEACEIARQAARGLAYIHQNGMVHRDLKPSNLMLTLTPAEGLAGGGSSSTIESDKVAVVKILDMGLALLIGDDQQRLTLFDDRAMGTAMYMSPEQWRTTSVDIRADIYSLGCTLYHLLAGKPPFWESDLRPEKAHERERLPKLDVPQELWGILERMLAKNPEQRFAEPADVAAALTPLAEGNQLASLIRQQTEPAPGAATQGIARSETRVTRSAESETIAGRMPSRWDVSSVENLKRVGGKIRRIVAPIALLVAVPVCIWLLAEAWQALRASRARTLIVAADSAAFQISKEIENRFAILQRHAADQSLRENLLAVNASPDDTTLWAPLQRTIGVFKADYDQEAPSDSWFINDRLGVQVARSPRSEKSLGNSYAHRDYFHGLGKDLEDVTDVEPIDNPNQSAVYRSSTSNRLKVAFSVPIWDRPKFEPGRQVIGVLAMSADLGEFEVLENVLDRDRGQEVVLIDTREDAVDGHQGRGLLLHHRDADKFGRGAAPLRFSPELLATIEQVLDSQDDPRQRTEKLLFDYFDPVLQAGHKYWGAFERVLIRGPEGESQDTGWVVLVQEPVD